MAEQRNPDRNRETDSLGTSINYGAAPDQMDFGAITRWLIGGIIVVAISLVGLYHMFNHYQFRASQRAVIEAEFRDVTERREREQQILNSFEVIDEEKGRYRIPIDSAISLILKESGAAHGEDSFPRTK